MHCPWVQSPGCTITICLWVLQSPHLLSVWDWTYKERKTSCLGLTSHLGQNQQLLQPHFFSPTWSCFLPCFSLWARCQHILFLSLFLLWEVYRGMLRKTKDHVLFCLVIPTWVCGFWSGSTWSRSSHNGRGSSMQFCHIHPTITVIINLIFNFVAAPQVLP